MLGAGAAVAVLTRPSGGTLIYSFSPKRNKKESVNASEKGD